MQRRDFLKKAAATTGLAAVGGLALPATAYAQDRSEYVFQKGRDLDGWITTLGDGIWNHDDQQRANRLDVDRVDHGTHSDLIGNPQGRGVMAHAIAFKRFWNMPNFAESHIGRAQFRIPTVPTMQNWDRYSIQTLEAGLFVWDGPKTRLDYGIAMQWMLNPWLDDFGTLRVWTQDENGPEWEAVGYLEPDTEWHEVDMAYSPAGHGTYLSVDDQALKAAETFTVKHDHWGNTIDGRFQLEVVSCWPGDKSRMAPATAEFRDWSWSIR